MSRTIGELTVKISGDEQSLVTSLRKASGEVKSFSTSTSNALSGVSDALSKGLVSGADAAKRSLDALRRSFENEMAAVTASGKVTADQEKNLKSLKTQIDETEASLKKLQKPETTGLQMLSQQFLTLGIAMKGLDLLKRGVEFNKMGEQAQAAFTVMLGSSEAAVSMLGQLRKWTSETPLEFKDARSAAQTLLQFGVDGSKVMDILKQLGDVSGGDAQRLQSLSLAFGQMSASGRLMGQDLLQMINAGFNPLQEISKRTGVSMEVLKKQMEGGAISSEMVAESFKFATSEGGQFFGMLEKQGKTLAGSMANANDALDQFLGSITQSLSGPLKGLLNAATALFNGFSSLPEPIQATAGAFIILAGSVGGLIIASRTLGITLSASFGPAGLIISGVLALIAGFSALNKTVNENIEANDKAITTLKQNATAAQGILGPVTDVNKAQKVSTEQITKLLAIYPELSRYLKDGTTSYEEMAAAIKLVNAERAKEQLKVVESQIANLKVQIDTDTKMRDSMKGRQSAFLNYQKKVDEGTASLISLNNQLAELKNAAAGKMDLSKPVNDLTTSSQKAIDASRKANDEIRKMAIARIEDEQQRQIDQYNFETDLGLKKLQDDKVNADAINAYKAERGIGLAQLLTDLDAEYYAQQAASQQAASDLIIKSQDDIATNAKRSAKDTFDEWKKQAESMNFVKDGLNTLKSAFGDVFVAIGEGLLKNESSWQKLGSIALKALSAVLRGLGDQLTAMGAVDLIAGNFAGAALALGGAAAAYIASGVISAAADQVGALYTGTANPLGQAGVYRVGEQGPETVLLPKGAQVLNASDTAAMESPATDQGKPAIITIMLDSKVLAKQVVQVINDGQAIIRVRA